MAVDALGPERARPYLEGAGATFPAAVDQENRLGALFGYKVVPNAIFLDEHSTTKLIRFGDFDIADRGCRRLAEAFAAGAELAAAAGERLDTFGSREALAAFHRGLDLYAEGNRDAALAQWRLAVSLEPGNYVIRKQLWAVEHPDRFYGERVDYDWQRQQLERGS